MLLEFQSFFTIETLKALLALIIIAFAADKIAKLFTKIKLPLITGFIIIGVLAGEYILKMLPEGLENLSFIEEISLGFIAYAAGTELYLKELRDRIRSISIMTASQFFITFIVSFFLIMLLKQHIPFIANNPLNTQIAIALLISTIFIARSPASAIAIIKELKAKGPYTQTAIGVTVAKDILVMILFTLTFGFAESLVKNVNLNIIEFLTIFLGLFITIVLGYLFGQLLKILFKININFFWELVLFLLSGYLIFIVSDVLTNIFEHLLHHTIHIEPLLAGVISGFYITNYTNYRLHLQRVVENAGNYIYVIFFTFIGATLAIDKLKSALTIIVLLFFIRLVAIMVASFVGSILIKDNWKLTLLSWTPYITQAGVSLGLIAVVGQNFQFGSDFETILVAVIIINQFVGPPLMKWAILQAGEAHLKAEQQFDGVNDVFIFGLEGKAIALGKILKRKNWNVKILSTRSDVSEEACKELTIVKLPDYSYETLKKVNLKAADVVVLLENETTSLQIVPILYEKFGTKTIIVRIEDRNFIKDFKQYENVIIVEPASAILNLLEHLVISPQATSIILGEAGQETMDIEVLNRSVHNVALRDLRFPIGILVLSINRNGQMILPHGYTRLRVGDIVTVVGTPDQLEAVKTKLQYSLNV